MAEPRLVLASGSPRRADLLARLGLDPEIRPAAVDETPLAGEPPLELVVRLADAKARAVRHPTADEVVLAADTIVVLDDQALGKPRDDAEAAAMLRRLSGRTHEVLTALAVHRGPRHHRITVTTQVRFRALTDTEVAWYLATGEPRDKAGAYALQGAGAALVDHLDGSDTNVIGLPLAATVQLLRRAGLDVLAPPTS
ncbi:MAG: septum formation inhibitor Maf [Nitriliruptor sp.]|nr:MAG: septum formation inhibitor Maf [Nitriliruptor sp.]